MTAPIAPVEDLDMLTTLLLVGSRSVSGGSCGGGRNACRGPHGDIGGELLTHAPPGVLRGALEDPAL